MYKHIVAMVHLANELVSAQKGPLTTLTLCEHIHNICKVWSTVKFWYQKSWYATTREWRFTCAWYWVFSYLMSHIRSLEVRFDNIARSMNKSETRPWGCTRCRPHPLAWTLGVVWAAELSDMSATSYKRWHWKAECCDDVSGDRE